MIANLSLGENMNNILDQLDNFMEMKLKNNWLDWYNNGYRKQGFFDYNNNDSSIEFDCLKELRDNVLYIKEDYFNQFGKDNGNWDSYVKNWDNLQIENVTEYFKYDVDKLEGRDINNLLMEYHVDEFFIENQFKHKRLVITINWYLNNDYNGGEICVYDSISDKVYEYKPNPGDIVVMPSTYPFYHAVKYFNNADRYFLRTFVDYEVNENDHYDWNKIKEIDEEYIKKDLQVLKIESLKNV